METWWTEPEESKLERSSIQNALEIIYSKPIQQTLLQKRVKFKKLVAVREISRLSPTLWYTQHELLEIRINARED